MLFTSVSPVTTNLQDITARINAGLPPCKPFPTRYKLTLTSYQITMQNPSKQILKLTWQRHWGDSIPFQQFQVLFNSLFKVLFIFPSRYLFAIGLAPIFSFRWNLPPTLSCIPKQLDSKKTSRTHSHYRQRREYHPLSCPLPRDLT